MTTVPLLWNASVSLTTTVNTIISQLTCSKDTLVVAETKRCALLSKTALRADWSKLSDDATTTNNFA